IFDLLKKRRSKKVMLTRFGNVKGEGLYSLAGYTDLQEETPKSTAILILQRLALNERRERDYYAEDNRMWEGTRSAPAVPHNLPRLQPFFGREEELKQIAHALDPARDTWGALI